jgi:SM-20-related protein
MPSASFFRNLGLFVQENFFETAMCDHICGEIGKASFEKGTITGSGSSEGELDETRRKVLSANVEEGTDFLVKQKLLEIKPRLEDHFRVSVSGCQGPNFLRYDQGAFYIPHRDASSGAPAEISQRRISVVVFLNARANEPASNCYGGGSLSFYGLMEGPEWEKCAFTLEADPGLLIAFRSDVLHEVKPVTFGQRFTIVSWFTTGG